MTRVAIGPDTCGLSLLPAGIRELRRRRGKDTWFYEPVPGRLDPTAVKRYALVSTDDEGLPRHSRAVPHGDYLGESATSAKVKGNRSRIYGFNETQDRTDPDLLAMAESPQEGWFGNPVKVVTVPDDVEWYVFEDEDGSESIHEEHRSWS